ncbi:acyl-CoA synthetase FdrA [Lachnospiraceae bacterium 54-53]
MIHTMIRKNSYMDSVELMLLSKNLGKSRGIHKASVMMGTPANKEIMKKAGFGSEKLKEAGPNDMIIAVDAETVRAAEAAMKEVKAALGEKKPGGRQNTGIQEVTCWEEVRELGEDYSLCLISVPGEYAAEEAMEALHMGKHVMLFSDHVSEADELLIKRLAHERGLLVMGPDCGTAVLSGVPLAFANRVRRGNIGIAGAAGTGIQETAVMVDRLGGGISHAIGTGGRDLHEKIGGITMKDAIAMLEADEETQVILVVSKPPAPEVKKELEGNLASLTKPAAVLFLGETERKACGHIHYTDTLESLARTGVSLSGKTPAELPAALDFNGIPVKDPTMIGLYSGGSLAAEAACLCRKALEITGEEKREGYLLYSEKCRIMDLGDDLYTRGKPHPMMDPGPRARKLRTILSETKGDLIILLDVVLGSGSCHRPADELAQAIREAFHERDSERGAVVFVNLLGTGEDSQGYKKQKDLLRTAGACVVEGNTRMVKSALGLLGKTVDEPEEQICPPIEKKPLPKISPSPLSLLQRAPGVINVGLKGFAGDLQAAGAKMVHFEWKPGAGGDRGLRQAIAYLNAYEFPEGPYRNMEEANEAVIGRIKESVPCLTDVLPAHMVTEVFEGKKLLLHAGTPMGFEEMTHPMQGSCVGAALFEGWAHTEEEAWDLLKRGEVSFLPCHHAGFVGPMGGITSAHMPVMKVKNLTGENEAYCTMNEGIGQVLRFGAYGKPVIDRLRFMRDTLGPVLGKALRTLEKGLNIHVMVSRAIAMGDEFHQRNIAASLVFLKEIAPIVSCLDIPDEDKQRVICFLADTDQFFLNIMMASAKAVMDYAAGIKSGTVVTVMSRNGKDFGIRISGMGEKWYTGPVNIPKGLYFTGFDEEMANPDMGDSAITETFGVGGMAMIAAPAVTRFVGTGGFYDALEISNRMSRITLSHNGMFPIPAWDFKGTCLGIDIRRVAATGITPVINTGIAHKVAGQGQIGAGTVNPPMECFAKALLDYARKLGFEGEPE